MTNEASLYRKLAEITEEVGVVEKGGFNDFHKYKYVEERHVLDMVRGKLAARKVVLFPSVTALSERAVTTQKGKHSTVTTLHVRFTFVDAESRETHECDWVGQGDDAGDKGVNKAATSALKYFLLKAFLIPTGEPDPEGDKGTDEGTDEHAAERTQSNGEPPEGAYDDIQVLGAEGGKDLLEALDKTVDRDRMRLAATHVRGFDIGDLTDDAEAAECLGRLTLEQVYRLRAWAEKKATEAKA